MTRRIVILGAGTGGTLAANRLRRLHSRDAVEITVVDQNDDHIYQPGLLFVPFGLKRPEELVRSRHAQLHDGIAYLQSPIDRVDVAQDTVVLADGAVLRYDVLIVATGATLLPDETPGLTGAGWNDTIFTFYMLEGATALAGKLAAFDEGRLVVNVIDMPIKCPVAPLEFCFLADWFFRKNGKRDRIDITYVTPLDGAFTRPIASQVLGSMLASKGVNVVTELNTGEVDSERKQLIGYDGRTVPYDLAVVVPLHGGAGYVSRSDGLGDELNFIPTDPQTLQSRVKPNIFAIGDAADIPASKAGSVTHFEGDILVENVGRYLTGRSLDGQFDGHANCFIETGFDKAVLIDFNYDTEPLPGHYPAAIGLPLLKESHLNHLGKLMFEWIYWHSLLPGHSLPGVGSAMPDRGKIHEPV
ncbi:MAG TPA: FAD/NAD(P)-binding oxidoreductase [Chloroflexota bacterium]|nr:FAD/NAD(P)-binding oxidoreductase [Chloroflexota bacterium]